MLKKEHVKAEVMHPCNREEANISLNPTESVT